MKYIVKQFSLVLLILCSALITFAQTTAKDWYDKGLDLTGDKKYEEAITAFSKSAQLNPKYTEALYELGWCYNELSQYDKAVVALNKALVLKKDDHKIYHELGYAYKKKGQNAEALKNLAKAIELKPDYALAFKDQGDVYKSMQTYQSAIESYKKCVEYDDENDDAYFELGYISNEMAEYQQAINWLNKSLDLNKDESAYNELGYAYYKLSKNNEAIEAYNNSIAINASSSTPYKGIGDVYRSNYSPARIADAETYYLKALQYNDKSAGSHYGLGWCYNEEEKFDQAIIQLQKTTELDPGYTSAFIELGYALYKKGKYEDALSKLRSAIKLNKESQLGHYYSGLCYVELKDKANATKMYEALQKLDAEQAKTLKEKIDKM